ncbi:MAG: hypothetical protein AAGD92_15175 [Pseudomonadota bacterium]
MTENSKTSENVLLKFPEATNTDEPPTDANQESHFKDDPYFSPAEKERGRQLLIAHREKKRRENGNKGYKGWTKIRSELIAALPKAVQDHADRNLSYSIFQKWMDGKLSDFKDYRFVFVDMFILKMEASGSFNDEWMYIQQSELRTLKRSHANSLVRSVDKTLTDHMRHKTGDQLIELAGRTFFNNLFFEHEKIYVELGITPPPSRFQRFAFQIGSFDGAVADIRVIYFPDDITYKDILGFGDRNNDRIFDACSTAQGLITRITPTSVFMNEIIEINEQVGFDFFPIDADLPTIYAINSHSTHFRGEYTVLPTASILALMSESRFMTNTEWESEKQHPLVRAYLIEQPSIAYSSLGTYLRQWAQWYTAGEQAGFYSNVTNCSDDQGQTELSSERTRQIAMYDFLFKTCLSTIRRAHLNIDPRYQGNSIHEHFLHEQGLAPKRPSNIPLDVDYNLALNSFIEAAFKKFERISV